MAGEDGERSSMAAGIVCGGCSNENGLREGDRFAFSICFAGSTGVRGVRQY